MDNKRRKVSKLGFEFQDGSLEENAARAEYFLTKNPSARSIEE